VELEAAEKAEEATLNSADRVRLALELGPLYPWEIAETTGLAVKTVKNVLTGLRKHGAVESTGERDGRAEQVRLIVPASLPYKGDGDEDDSPSGLRAFLADPPEWLATQLERCREDPGRLLNPTANAIAAKVLGSRARWREVRPVLAEYLEGARRE
jgi:hypothetical protein